MVYFNMPANLPPEYYEAEVKYKQAVTPQEKVAALEALISTIPKHKGTDKIRADLRRRLSKLRVESSKKTKAGRGDLYTVEKQGAAQIALVGFPNSGKSSILASVTNAHPVIADYPLSTVLPTSGMMPFEDIQFQLVDLPPIANESTDGWVSGILRTSNMLILVVDLADDADIQAELILDQLSEWKIPVVKKEEKGEEKEIILPKPVIIAANKYDLPEAGNKLNELIQWYDADYPIIAISAKYKRGIDILKKSVFLNSRIIRVYSKEPGKEPDTKTPFTLPCGSNVIKLAEIIHKDFLRNLKYACIWGSAKFEGQRVHKDYVLHDRDIVEYHLK
jgi:ribosome-interacting GTPase 1